MRKFRFRLETLERVRKSREDDMLRALGAAQKFYQENLSQKQVLLETLSNALIRREKIAEEAVTPNIISLEEDFIVGTRVRITQQDQAILRARRGVEKALRNFLLARRQTRVMELLREKAFAEWKKSEIKREAKELNELYVMRAGSFKEAS